MVYHGLPIKNGDFPWLTVSHNQMVNGGFYWMVALSLELSDFVEPRAYIHSSGKGKFAPMTAGKPNDRLAKRGKNP